MPQTKEEIKSKRLYKTYGINIDDFNRMLQEQEGVCWICKTLPKSGVLCCDHLHVKGYKKMDPSERRKYLRGLVCFGCNTVFARFERRKNPRFIMGRVIEYFKQFPMKGDVI